MPAVEITIPLRVTARMKLRIDAGAYDTMTPADVSELARESVREAVNAIGTDDIPIRCRGAVSMEIEEPMLDQIHVEDPRG